MTRIRTAVLATVSSLAAAALAIATFALAPPAQAQATSIGHVAATIHVPPMRFVAVVSGGHWVWLVDADENSFATVVQIDPVTNTVHRTSTLDIAAGGAVTGYGSLWVSAWNANLVERIDPATLRVLARIPVGLGPEWLHAAFGAIWVANHHDHSVMRIDPTTNRVVKTFTVGAIAFRNGPQAITDDGRYLYASSSNQTSLAKIDPRTNRLQTPIPVPALFCGNLTATGGRLWEVDFCDDSLYSVDPANDAVTSFGYAPAQVTDLTTLNGVLWVAKDTTVDPTTGQGTGGGLDARDGTSGALLGSVVIGGDVSNISAGFGSLWTYDPGRATLRRVDTAL